MSVKTAQGGEDPKSDGVIAIPSTRVYDALRANHHDNGFGWCIGCNEHGGSVPIGECNVSTLLSENEKNIKTINDLKRRLNG